MTLYLNFDYVLYRIVEFMLSCRYGTIPDLLITLLYVFVGACMQVIFLDDGVNKEILCSKLVDLFHKLNMLKVDAYKQWKEVCHLRFFKTD